MGCPFKYKTTSNDNPLVLDSSSIPINISKFMPGEETGQVNWTSQIRSHLPPPSNKELDKYNYNIYGCQNNCVIEFLRNKIGEAPALAYYGGRHIARNLDKEAIKNKYSEKPVYIKTVIKIKEIFKILSFISLFIAFIFTLIVINTTINRWSMKNISYFYYFFITLFTGLLIMFDYLSDSIKKNPIVGLLNPTSKNRELVKFLTSNSGINDSPENMNRSTLVGSFNIIFDMTSFSSYQLNFLYILISEMMLLDVVRSMIMSLKIVS